MINLDIILTISLYLNKTCLKPSYQRVSEHLSQQESLKSALNTMTFGVLLTVIMAFGICFFQIFEYSEGVPYFEHAIVFYGLSAVAQAIQEKYNS